MAKKEGIFLSLLLLTSFFILLEISFLIQCYRSYFGVFEFVADNVSIPLAILPGIIGFITAQLFIHCSFTVLCWFLTLLIAHYFQLKKSLMLALCIWFVGILTVLVANRFYFPNSKFAELLAIFLPNLVITKIILTCLILLCGLIILMASISLIVWLKQQINFLISSLLIGALGFGVGFYPTKNGIQTAASELRPNIILVGIDSLRPDFLGFFGGTQNTPFLDGLLENSTVFTAAYTPLARTYPSWMSILMGEHPRNLGIRFNLSNVNDVDFYDSLPAILRRKGYETIYATDETRFSNIDKSVGFKQIITPPMGLNDFLLGNFNDFPLSNLLVNTLLGKWLFPYSYANRPVYFTYQPNTFINLLKPALKQRYERPVFMTVHFCLPHYPYIWASYSGQGATHIAKYLASLKAVDQQVQDFFHLLQQQGYLKHAIVVVLSDHGEALELKGDRITEMDKFLLEDKTKTIPKFYPPSLDNEEINQSIGHGGDVLGLSQYRSLLAFRFYGFTQQAIKEIPDVVSLMSIKPTLLELIKVPNEEKQVSLVKFIQGSEQKIPIQHVLLESDFSPEAIRTVYPEVSKVVLEGVALFQIDPINLRLTVKPNMGNMIINSKQYADLYGNWMLALYPQNKLDRMPILINLATGQWTNDLQSEFAKQSPVNEMVSELKRFYGEELSISTIK